MRGNIVAKKKGQSNYEYKTVAVVPASCPKCQSTELFGVDKPPLPRDISGVINGQPYNRIVWRDKQCRACGQRVRVRTWENIISKANK